MTCILFVADMKVAFDRIKSEELWSIMNKSGVDKQLRDNIRKVYKGTRCAVRVDGTSIGSFRARKGVSRNAR